MPDNTQDTRNLYYAGLSEIAGGLEPWLSFLSACGRLAQHSFAEQILVHHQRPNASYCASLAEWNERKFFVRSGAKSIAVLQDENNAGRLRFLFDVADTTPMRSARPFTQWELHEEARPFVAMQIFGDTAGSFEAQLYNHVLEQVSTKWESADSWLEESADLLAASAAYAVFSRCGADLRHLRMEDFTALEEWRELDRLAVLGQAVSDIAGEMLAEIEGAVLNWERDSLAKAPPILHTENTEEPPAEKENREETEHEPDIQARGRLPLPEPDRTNPEPHPDGPLRPTAQSLSERTPSGTLQPPADERAAGRAPAPDRRSSQADDRADDGAADAQREPAQPQPEPAGMGRGDEQPAPQRRGTGDARPHIQQLSLFGEAETAQNLEKEESEPLSSFFVPETSPKRELGTLSEEEIRDILRYDWNMLHKKPEVVTFFEANPDVALRSKYLEDAYDEAYIGILRDDGQRYGYHKAKNVEGQHPQLNKKSGLMLVKGNFLSPAARLTLSWEEAVAKVNNMIEEGDYLPYHIGYAGQTQPAPLTELPLPKIPAHTIGPEDITAALRHGPGVMGGKNRIHQFFQKKRPQSETIAFLKGEYGTGGCSFTFPDGTHGGLDYNPMKGLELRKGGLSADVSNHRVLKWPEVARELRTLVLAGRYLGKEAQAEWAAQQESAEVAEAAFASEADSSPAFEMRELVIDLSPKEEATLEPDTETALLPEEPFFVTSPPAKSPPPLPNYHITDTRLGETSPAERAALNLAAICALKEIEAGRTAIPADQEAMARYTGWGSLPQVFDPESKAPFAEETRKALQALLSEEEYKAARASTLNAHYTSPLVISAIYKVLENAGFHGGNVLEPAMGVGNFFGMLPASMQNAQLYGTELDPITGTLARQLYPSAKVTVGGFEDSGYPDAFFDLAIGNVPFGNYKVADPKYDKLNIPIHEYFFAKTLDKVRPGGLVAFVTSKYTMDKKNDTTRRYIAERAELLGAIRLPNTAFKKKNAGTEVTADILFLKRREAPLVVEEPWLHLGQTTDGVPCNQYFVQHPEMVLGQMVFDDKMYGNGRETACVLRADEDFGQRLEMAAGAIRAEYTPAVRAQAEKSHRESLPATPEVRNFSYTLVQGELYFRVNSLLEPVETNPTAAARIRALLGIRDSVRGLIQSQLDGSDDAAIEKRQAELNRLYDGFVRKWGRISSQANGLAFRDDDGYYLLCSLEVTDEDGNFLRKADMFSRRTIGAPQKLDKADTPAEALAISIGEKARVDLPFMQRLLPGGTTQADITHALRGIIFHDPLYDKSDFQGWQPADQYLSGNVREKLRAARLVAESDPDYAVNVEALEAAQPKTLGAAEIEVRLGATWVPVSDVQDFTYETLGTALWAQRKIQVLYSERAGEWNITNKSGEGSGNDRVNIKYGTRRMNAYHILENTLNLRTVKVYDTVQEPDGSEKRVLNAKETMLAQQKQDLLKQAFKDWIFSEPSRRERLAGLYNERFNAIRPREYEGSHLHFAGMNPEISLKPHQKNAVARGLYGGNALLAHVVGAGKTYEMAAIAMESKRLGLCGKSLFVVPNHLTQQWAGEFLQLYPSAKLLVTTKADFETSRRKQFCGKISTGDYDAIIMGHSQFEKVPMSRERQLAQMEWQVEQLEAEIEELRSIDAQRYTIKQAERSKKSLEVKMKRLMDAGHKDQVVTFEELGVDRLFIDEAHSFKNLFLYSKLRNISGVGSSEAQKSTDLFLKCQYMDEITEGRGIVFATGTPISNSMSELYTMMRYLQMGLLRQTSMTHFDSWASTFGETVTAIELAPEGTGFRPKTRFARFYNLPELMTLWREAADIQTADMLNLPVPALQDGRPIDIVVEPSEHQQEILKDLAIRAQQCRAGCDPKTDNMLKVTSDGRKMALDQRLLDPSLPDDPGSKLNACVDNIYRIWKETQEKRLTQLVFSDLGTPKRTAETCENSFDTTSGQAFDVPFNVYEDIFLKLRRLGVPASEIAFVHDAGSDAKKASLFAKVRSGQVRILLGSTAKMGAGTNCQTSLVALHHLDVPWRPSDIEQREGRMIRQGNQNEEVAIYRYVTKGTFDAYSWGVIKNKQTFISQVMTSRSPVRSCEDVDESVLSYAEVMALATGDVRIKERVDLETDLTRLKVLRANHLSQKYDLEDRVHKLYPQKISQLEQEIALLEKDKAHFDAHRPAGKDEFGMEVNGVHYKEKEDAGKMLLLMRERAKSTTVALGHYCGFPMEMEYSTQNDKFVVNLQGAMRHSVAIGEDVHGNIQRLNNCLEGFGETIEKHEASILHYKEQSERARADLALPFAGETEMQQKQQRYDELTTLLNMAEKGADLSVNGEEQETEAETAPPQARQKMAIGLER